MCFQTYKESLLLPLVNDLKLLPPRTSSNFNHETNEEMPPLHYEYHLHLLRAKASYKIASKS